MFLVTCLIGLVYLIGISTFILASHKAPEGFQDEEGFHYGSEEIPTPGAALRNESADPPSGASPMIAGRIHAH